MVLLNVLKPNWLHKVITNRRDLTMNRLTVLWSANALFGCSSLLLFLGDGHYINLTSGMLSSMVIWKRRFMLSNLQALLIPTILIMCVVYIKLSMD